MVEQVALAVAAGTLTPGDRLPSVRKLASFLRINPNTTARALREMDRLGLARTVRGAGSEVASSAPGVARRIARRILAREVERAVTVAIDLGIEAEELQAAVDEKWKELTDAHRS